MKPLLVGEVNPLSDRPEHALYPWPPNCSGERLQRLVMGVSRHDYLRNFDRVDLCVGKWSLPAARARAAQLLLESGGNRPAIVLLGTKVCAAFGATYDSPFRIGALAATPTRAQSIVILPHPSGLCRLWHQPDAYERAREVLRRAGVLPPASTPGKFAG